MTAKTDVAMAKPKVSPFFLPHTLAEPLQFTILVACFWFDRQFRGMPVGKRTTESGINSRIRDNDLSSVFKSDQI